MNGRGWAVAALMAAALAVASRSPATGQALPTSAKVNTEPLDLSAPDRFLIPSVLEAIRGVSIVATADGIVRAQDAKAGSMVREGQEIAQLDRGEAGARLKIAQAEIKREQAAVDLARARVKDADAATGRAAVAQAQADLDAARARAELAQLAFDGRALKAPFGGKVLASPVSEGQFVVKGTVLAELADVSSLRALVPIARDGASVGGTLTLNVEGQSVSGAVQALIPLPERLVVLRELARPLVGAWVVLPNPSGALEPGQRVLSPALPTAPIATIPAHALLKTDPKDKKATPTVQVIRDDTVTNVKVQILGTPVPERLQVSGAFLPTDALIVSTTVPLLSGTLIRFNGGSTPSDGAARHPGGSGNVAASGAANVVAPTVAPIGTPGSALPRSRSVPRPVPAPSAPANPALKAGAVVPF